MLTAAKQMNLLVGLDSVAVAPAALRQVLQCLNPSQHQPKKTQISLSSLSLLRLQAGSRTLKIVLAD